MCPEGHESAWREWGYNYGCISFAFDLHCREAIAGDARLLHIAVPTRLGFAKCSFKLDISIMISVTSEVIIVPCNKNVKISTLSLDYLIDWLQVSLQY